MTPARFGLQAFVVLVLAALVSWPQQRNVRAGSLPAMAGRAVTRPGDTSRGRSTTDRRRYLIGYGSASEFTVGAGAAAALHQKLYANDIEGQRRPTPNGVLTLGGKVNGIVGFASTSVGGAIPFAAVLLRNVETGAVEARGVADEYGRFAFLDLIPSGYVIEVLDASGRVIAASEVIPIRINELREAFVRASGRHVFASFGGGLAPTAQNTVAAAASQGVNRVAPPDRCASPPCDNPNR
jgi:hypothetical protein